MRVLDLPLGDTSVLEGVAVMKNYLGGENEDISVPAGALAEPRAKIHFTARKPSGPQDWSREYFWHGG